MEGIEKQYLKWSLGLDRCTPEYMVKEETKRDKMRIRLAKLAMNFEEKAKTGHERRRWVEECIKEREGRRMITRSMSEREEYLERYGVQEENLEQWRSQGRRVAEELSKLDRRRQMEE